MTHDDHGHGPTPDGPPWTRRHVLGAAACATTAAAAGIVPDFGQAQAAATTEGIVAPVALTLRVNGADHRLGVEPRVTLLDALRDHLDLAGTKKGCGHGECGACTVHLDGRRIKACMTFAVMHDHPATGDEVLTIEGLAGDGGEGLHPVQAAFLEHDGFQCGYCTPGQIMSAVGVIAEARAGWPSAATPDPRAPFDPGALGADEIRERMSGNLCRCGAYRNIVRAVEAAATTGRG